MNTIERKQHALKATEDRIKEFFRTMLPPKYWKDFKKVSEKIYPEFSKQVFKQKERLHKNSQATQLTNPLFEFIQDLEHYETDSKRIIRMVTYKIIMGHTIKTPDDTIQ